MRLTPKKSSSKISFWPIPNSLQLFFSQVLNVMHLHNLHNVWIAWDSRINLVLLSSKIQQKWVISTFRNLLQKERYTIICPIGYEFYLSNLRIAIEIFSFYFYHFSDGWKSESIAEDRDGRLGKILIKIFFNNHVVHISSVIWKWFNF